MLNTRSIAFAALAWAFLALPAAAAPKLDKETCDQLKIEQAKFAETGIMADLQRGAQWGKANLSAERLREIEHFILLDEQLKFGCRQVTLTVDAMRAGEAANRIETNPNADPTVNPAAAGAGVAEAAEGGASPPGTAPVTSTPNKPAAKPRTERRPSEKTSDKPPERSTTGTVKPKTSDAYVVPGPAQQNQGTSATAQ
jgi:hypothetical protein